MDVFLDVDEVRDRADLVCGLEVQPAHLPAPIQCAPEVQRGQAVALERRRNILEVEERPDRLAQLQSRQDEVAAEQE